MDTAAGGVDATDAVAVAATTVAVGETISDVQVILGPLLLNWSSGLSLKSWSKFIGLSSRGFFVEGPEIPGVGLCKSGSTSLVGLLISDFTDFTGILGLGAANTAGTLITTLGLSVICL